jgi:hypothetical protein
MSNVRVGEENNKQQAPLEEIPNPQKEFRKTLGKSWGLAIIWC